jgi:alpha-ribazole phosphatase
MTPKTRIYLIRHGEVEGVGTPRYNGHRDVSLTAGGVAQYHRLKERFAGARITACYTSDLSRCVTGAEILGTHLDVTPTRDRNLRELNIGIRTSGRRVLPT